MKTKAIVMLGCAWVLWEEFYFSASSPPTRWTLHSASPVHNECEDAAQRLRQRTLSFLQAVPDAFRDLRSESGYIFGLFYREGREFVGVQTYTYRCLPDTIDPRPRGKE